MTSTLTEAALGFRVKSGWATALLLTGPVAAPQVAARGVVDLSDPALPETRQPYHAAVGTLQTDEARIKRLRNVITRFARDSVAKLLSEFGHFPHQIRAAGLVVGSTIDPAKVTNPHIRAHALEGQLFRTVLEDALRTCDISCLVIVERTLYARAAQSLQRTEEDLKQTLAHMRRGLRGPWRAEEKAAALAGWLALA
jgi:hypothetical protein